MANSKRFAKYIYSIGAGSGVLLLCYTALNRDKNLVYARSPPLGQANLNKWDANWDRYLFYINPL